MPSRVLLIVCAVLGVFHVRAAVPEEWVVNVDRWGNASYRSLVLVRDRDGTLSGTIDGDPLQGTIDGDTIGFVVTDVRGRHYRFDGEIDEATMRGTADFPDPNDAARRATHRFTARRIPPRPHGPPCRHEYVPADYANEFSPHRLPVLTIWPGDTVRTTTVDSGGIDAHGVTRALYGNPQTGPFYVAGAAPGDTLVVRIDRLRPNRAYADSLDDVVGRARSNALAAKAGALGRPVRWKLDQQRGVATPDTPARLKDFSVPLRPMLGGLAVAPGPESPPVSTGDTGRFGGNMDFNEIVEGVTVYLPVLQPGALLYLGDAHALQGDGETSQFALEVSMEVEFTVDLIHGRSVPMPRVESPTHLMVLGQAGSLEDALRAATAGMMHWLREDYGLDLSESAQVMGSAIQYEVANLAGRNVGVAAKLEKSPLAPLRLSVAGAAKE